MHLPGNCLECLLTIIVGDRFNTGRTSVLIVLSSFGKDTNLVAHNVSMKEFPFAGNGSNQTIGSGQLPQIERNTTMTKIILVGVFHVRRLASVSLVCSSISTCGG